MLQLKRWEHLKIPLEEIKEATKNFQVNRIGKGGYGTVYQGELVISGKPTIAAIKRLDEKYGQGLKEFLTEIDLLSGQNHPNLIDLLGYCDEGVEKIIVYEYAERGSLDKYLGGNNITIGTLTWWERLEICVGAARGLDHLHNGLENNQTIIHRDVKSSNILIDKEGVAKISDLGLSKLIDRSYVVSHVCGTRAYCEPEYHKTSIVTKESDVYSFGLVLFEVLCGRLCTIKYDDGILLSSSLAKEHYEKNILYRIIDPSLQKDMNFNSMIKFAEIAYRCLNDVREQRPTMREVLEELEKLSTLQLISILEDDAKKPGWKSSKFSQSSGSKSDSKIEFLSSSSKPYLKTESQSSSYESCLKSESQSSSYKSYLKSESQSSNMEPRLEKVIEIFQQFDLNKDGGLNKEELEALLVARNDLKDYSHEQINCDVDEVFRSYDMFIDGEKGLTCDGLLQIYDDDDNDGEVDIDYEVLGLNVKPHNDKEPTSDRYENLRINRQQIDLNTAPNYGVEETRSSLDDFFNLYEDGGPLWEGAFQELRSIDDQVVLEQRNRNSRHMHLWLHLWLAFPAAWFLLLFLGIDPFEFLPYVELLTVFVGFLVQLARFF